LPYIPVIIIFSKLYLYIKYPIISIPMNKEVDPNIFYSRRVASNLTTTINLIAEAVEFNNELLQHFPEINDGANGVCVAASATAILGSEVVCFSQITEPDYDDPPRYAFQPEYDEKPLPTRNISIQTNYVDAIAKTLARLHLDVIPVRTGIDLLRELNKSDSRGAIIHYASGQYKVIETGACINTGHMIAVIPSDEHRTITEEPNHFYVADTARHDPVYAVHPESVPSLRVGSDWSIVVSEQIDKEMRSP
jgi:hypothetical protein